MRWSTKAGILGASIAVIFAASLAWRAHRQKIAEWERLSAVAAETRTRAEHGDAAAQNHLGNLYLAGKGVPKDYEQAVLWYRKAAEQGDRRAEFNLGEMYELGEGALKDYGEAIHWLRKSADQSDTRAQIALGHMYFNGEGVMRDECQGFAWYRKAAEAGHVPAQQFVGWMYFNGRGVQKDYIQAAAWFQKAADQGDPVAQLSLGYMYAYGTGVERDSIAGLRWYRMAAAQGNPDAIRFLESIRPPAGTQRLELGMGIVDSIAGLVFLLPLCESILRRKMYRGWLMARFATLRMFLFALAALDFYASAHDIRYSPYHASFHMVRRILDAIAVLLLLICTVVLPRRRTQDPALRELGHR